MIDPGVTGGKAELSLFDLNGKLILKKEIPALSQSVVSTEAFTPGVYLVRVQSQGNSFTRKIVIN